MNSQKLAYTSQQKCMPIGDLDPFLLFQYFLMNHKNGILLENWPPNTGYKQHIIGIEPLFSFRAKGNQYQIKDHINKAIIDQGHVDNSKDIFIKAKQFYLTLKSQQKATFISKGLFGFNSFESVQYMEQIRLKKKIYCLQLKIYLLSYIAMSMYST